MPSSLRNPIPLTFTARGLSDATDGSNVPRGAMRVLTNLISNPRNTGQMICRPAAVRIEDLATYFDTPTQITGMEVVGNLAYGMVSTATYPGKDEPFCFDLAANANVAVTGVTAASLPASPALTGEWEPPILRHVGSRVVVTHPGFTDPARKFGWFDISSFSTTITGNMDEQRVFVGDTDSAPAMAPYIVGLPPGTLPGAADVGFTVTGAGVQAGSTIEEVTPVSVVFAGDITAASPNVVNVAINGTPDTTGIYVGQAVQGSGIAAGTQVATINRAGFALTLTIDATATTAGNAMSALGNQVKLSKDTTATADGVTFTMFNQYAVTGNPDITGLQPGMLVTGGGAPANTKIVSVGATQIVTSGTTVVGSNEIAVPIYPSGISIGMTVTGAGIPTGSVVTGTTGTLTTKFIIISNPATASGTTGITLTGTQILLDQPVTTPALGATLTVSGGTKAAPLWGSGDTAPINLPSAPLGVGAFNGRAYYALGEDGIGFSDALLPCQITNATQFLVPDNGLAVTAIGELKGYSTTLGFVVRGLAAFQSDVDILQITGDPTTANLTLTDLSCATGTHAPLTLASTTKGLLFVSPQGLRLMSLSGEISDPIGQDGSGIVGPFLDVTNPPLAGTAPASRMAAAANGRTYIVGVPKTDGTTACYWYDMIRGGWTGPHSCAVSMIRTWTSSFVAIPTATGQTTTLFRLDDTPVGDSTYVEFGDQLTWEWEPSLMPDTGQMSENCIIESSIMVALPPGEQVQIDFLNEVGQNLDGVAVAGYVIPQAYWGDGTWGNDIWGGTWLGPDQGTIRQRQIPWTTPLVFKQGTVNIRGLSSSGIVLGNLYLRYQVQGYLLEVQQFPVALGGGAFLLANDGITILRNNTAVNLRPD